MVLVVGLAWCATYLAAYVVYSPGSCGGLRNELNDPVTRGFNVGSALSGDALLVFKALNQN